MPRGELSYFKFTAMIGQQSVEGTAGRKHSVPIFPWHALCDE